MSLSALALKTALAGLIRADAALARLIGAARLLPREVSQLGLPFLIETGWVTSDNSTATETGEAAEITYTLFAEPFAGETPLAVAARLTVLLEAARPVLSGLRLVSIDHLSTRTRPDPRSRAQLTEITFRAVVEVG